MACFLVTVAEAVVVSVVTRAVEAKEQKMGVVKTSQAAHSVGADSETKVPFSKKLKWLNNLLWGGSFLLAFEHVWSGEVVPWFPFLTAAKTAEITAEMLHEMATSGVAMAALVTAVWVGMVLVSGMIEKRTHKENLVTSKEGAV